MDSNSIMQWLCEKFRQYYLYAQPTINEINRREFGFGGWEKKIEFRHLSFENPQALWAELKNRAPLYVSCSGAYYEFPSGRPMFKKNWLGADLIFDLDAEPDELSPFITYKSLDKVKSNALTLIEDFLIADFGFSESDLRINFSGSRGYHVRAYNKDALTLAREQRREIVDYIEGAGLNFSNFFSQQEVSLERETRTTHMKRLLGPSPTMGGYKGKFARRILKMLDDPTLASSISPKLKKPENAQKFSSGVLRGVYSNVQIPNAIENFSKIFEQMKLKLSNQVETDANVTIDTSKILRLPDSLHGGSGLIAKTVNNFKSLQDFDPLVNAVAFSGSKTQKIIAMKDIPSMQFLNQTFEKILKNTTTQVPEGYAIYLICKRCAHPIVEND